MSRTPSKLGISSHHFWSLMAVTAFGFSAPPDVRAIEIEQLWVASPNMIMEGAPMVVDLDADGDAEILTAAYENIIVVDGSGSELWRFDTRGRYSTCPAILERPSNTPLIYAGDHTGQFTCLDGRGNVVWQKDLPSIFCASPAVADINDDGIFEVIQGDKTGKVHVMNALTGAPVWMTQIEGECASPAVGDLNGDGKLEIVMATGAGKIYALSAAGAILWTFDLQAVSPDWSTCSAVIFGTSTGQVRVVAGSRLGRFVCLDEHGGLVWERALRGALASTISVADFDADGAADVFAVTQLGVLYRFDESGRAVWDIDTQGRSLAPGAIVDLDGDGALEYVLCTQNGNLMVFGNAGRLLNSHQFENRTINMTATCGDIVKNRSGLEFAVTGGESGRIFCFGVSGPVDTLVPWRTYRCDNGLTGAWFGLSSSRTARMAPENMSWESLLTGDELVFSIANPESDGLAKAEAVCIRPDGSRQAAVGKVAGNRGSLQMPLSITAPGVYRFEWTLTSAAGTRLAFGSRELTLLPYQNDHALARRATSSLREAIGANPVARNDRGIRGALNREATELEREIDALTVLQSSVPGASRTIVEQTNARTVSLNARSKRALVLADLAESLQARTPMSKLVAFEGRTWENREVNRQLPSAVALPLTIQRRCVVGEHEPVSVKLFNVTLDTIRASVRFDIAPAGPKVIPMEAKPVPTNLNSVGWDALPKISRQVAVPPLETREVWLDVDLTGVAPGQHRVVAIFGDGAGATRVEIALNVMPFEMAGYRDLRLCNWAVYNRDAVRDLLAHGNTVFTMGLPSATIAAGSPPRITIDFAAQDTFTAQLAGHDAFLLLSGVPNLGVPTESPEYVTRFADYIGQVISHLAAQGIAESNLAFYPYDEPGGHGWSTVNSYVAFARQALKARPALKFYVNGGGDLPMFEAFNEIAGVWCPGYYMLHDNSVEMNFIRASGKTLWSYDCGLGYARPIGWHSKTINVAGQYRMSAVFTVTMGATGLGYWCYNNGPSMWDAIEAEFPLVYTNSDGTHTASRRWEAVREGMEDARILLALRAMLTDPSISASGKTKIRHLVEVTAPAFTRQSMEEVRIGAARYVLDATNNDDSVRAFREELLDCVAATQR